MESKFENNVLTIYLSGNIDSNNAESVGQEIDEIRKANPDGALVLDLEDLVYISSAGLRQVLRLKKQEKDYKLINVSSDIYDIFEMTGFSEMMTIEKAYRKVSIDGLEKIGEGSNGIVYRINDDTIIKVYKNAGALEDIKRERELAKTALVLGVNTAIPFDVVKVGDTYGSIFELLSAKSVTKLVMGDEENKEKYVKIFVNLLKEIHATQVKPNLLPDARLRAIGWCEDLKDYLDENTYTKLHTMLENVPESLNMIHGDYHTNNVHYDGKEAILIDMDTLSTGNPVFEFSNFFLAYRGFGELDKKCVEDFLKISWDAACYILDKTFDLYFEGKPQEEIEQAKLKAQCVGFTRLYRRTLRRDKDNIALINHCHDRLVEVVSKVNDLAL